MKFISFLLLSILAFSCSPGETSNIDQTPSIFDILQADLEAINIQQTLPGFALSIFTKDSIIYQNGFGYSDLHNKQPYTVDNIQIIASITKTLVGVALMKSVENGLLSLDDPINKILPYPVINPNFPDVPITIRHLATHTSSIGSTKHSDKGYRFNTPLLEEEFPEAYLPLLEQYNKTQTLSMSDYLAYKLNATEKWYESEIFSNHSPGTYYEYSNLAVTLLAHIIEIKTGKSFSTYTQDLILDPISMQASTWKLNDIDSTKAVTYYNELYNVISPYYIVSYPDGGLYSSVADLTKYLQEIMRGYEGESDLLSATSFREMTRQQFEGEELTEGLCWDLSFTGLIGHGGNDFGTATLMYFSPTSGIGRILFTNISIETEEQEDAFYGIFNTLFEYNF